MNAKERYNRIIEEIEYLAGGVDLRSDEIAMHVTRSSGMNLRDLSNVISFLVGTTLVNYIKERRLMASYKYLISQEKFDVVGALEIAGYDNQQSYTKKFSQSFAMPPKEAFKRKDMSLFTEASTWSSISCETKELVNGESEVEQVEENRVFGISRKQFDKVSEALELSSLYGFEQHFSDYAFEFAEEHKVPLKDAFRYVDSLRTVGVGYAVEDDDRNESVYSPEEDLRDIGEDTYLIRMFFERDISVVGAWDLRDTLCLPGEAILALDPRMLSDFMKCGMEIDFDYFCNAFEYYMENADEGYGDLDYEQYWDRIGAGFFFKDAFASLPGCSNIDSTDYEDDRDEVDWEWERSSSIERMAEEEEKWSGERIDIELDMDNYEYDFDDEYGSGLLDF